MLKVGIVGCGFMGRMHGNVYSAVEDAKLVACVDYKADRGEKFAEEFGIKLYGSVAEMVEAEGLDIVDVCVPTHLHREYTEQGFAAGCHVLCEKPMALSLSDADAMIEAWRNSGKQFMIAHCIRFWPEYVKLKEIVESKRLGDLLSVNFTRYGAFPSWASDGWNLDESKSGGGVLDMHIHDTDFVLYMLGEPDSMQSWGTVNETGASHVFTTMTYGGGRTVAHLEGGWNLPKHAPFKMAFRAIFEDGCVIMDGGPMTIYQGDNEPEVPQFEKMSAAGGGNISDLGGYFHEIKYFVGCILADKTPQVVTPETSRQSLDYTLQEISQLKQKITA